MKYILVSCRYELNKNNEILETVSQNYLDQLRIRGLVPIILSSSNYNEELLENASSFLIIGGVDVNPKLYGEEDIACKKLDDRLDDLDLKMVDYAVKHHKPLLGICRGHQVINVYFGSKMIQHVEGHSYTRHNILKTRDSKFTELLGDDFEVNSFHHQVVKECVYPMIEEYKSKDEGYVEASSHANLPILTVQWHPEKDPDAESTKKVFDYFLDIVNNN